MVVSAVEGVDEAVTHQESLSKYRRTVRESQRLLSGIVMYNLLGGAGIVTVLGCFEGAMCIKSKSKLPSGTMPLSMGQKLTFVARYSLAQVIPSVIHATQPSTLIAQILKLPVEHFYATPCEAPPQRHLMLNRIMAMRGALAGTVILAQVLSVMDVMAQVRKDYEKRIRSGREPPLQDSSRIGVFVRLAGETSFMSNLTMAREGRRQFFPIFENPWHPDVKSMVNDHASATPAQHMIGPKVDDQKARVPIFWKVSDGRYSHRASWRGMVVPRSWLFPLPIKAKDEPQKQLLILEGDATSGSNTAMNLQVRSLEDFDLDLYEVAQGFSQLQSMVEDQSEADKRRNIDPNFETMRILLVDTDCNYTSGGGRKETARQHAMSLGLADVIVDARDPLVFSMTRWLKDFEHKYDQINQWNYYWRSKLFGQKDAKENKRRPIILETPRRDWFLSIKDELDLHGYDVIDHEKAIQQFGSLEGIPFFVYERTTADTLKTTKQHVLCGNTTAKQMCALCPRPWPLEAIMDDHEEGVTYISSSDIHDRLMRWVRYQALQGKSASVIQEQLDTRLPEILQEAMTHKRYTNRDYIKDASRAAAAIEQ